MTSLQPSSTLYEVAEKFDQHYDGFVVGAYYRAPLVALTLTFKLNQNSEDVVRSAAKALHSQLEHHIRPFGYCRLKMPTSQNQGTFVHVGFEETHPHISDLTLHNLLSRMVALAGAIVKTHGLI